MIEARDDDGLAKEWLDDLIRGMDELLVLLDRAKLKVADGHSDLRDLIQRAGTDFEEVRGDLRRVRDDVRSPSGEIVRNMRRMVKEVAVTLEHIVAQEE